MRARSGLASLFVLLVGASPGRADRPDAGTLRANTLVVPPSLREKRERRPPPPLPSELFLLGSPEVLAALGEFHAQIGAWAEYMVTEHGKPASRVLISVLPPPMPDGTYWMEIDATAEGVLPAAIKVLTKNPPTDPASFRRIIVELLGQDQIELPISLMQRADETPKPLAASGAQVKAVAKVRIKVAAGEYDADKLQVLKGKDRYTIWRSSAVPLFGLVRSEGKGSVTELVACGRIGAHSLLDAPVRDENVPAEAQGNGNDNK